jgi:hypothetical protein
MRSGDPKYRRLRRDRWFGHPASRREDEARMKRVLRVRAEVSYDIGPGLPCPFEVLLKAKGEADRIHIS